LGRELSGANVLVRKTDLAASFSDISRSHGNGEFWAYNEIDKAKTAIKNVAIFLILKF
jgi:hypothetical protein